MNLLQKLEEGILKSQYNENEQRDYLYEKLKSRLECGIPEYIIKNKKTIVDILEEKLNMIVIKEDEPRKRDILE